jgi:hypothetical protein
LSLNAGIAGGSNEILRSMRTSLLVLALGFFIGIGSANACDSGKVCKTVKGKKATTAACTKAGKCTMAEAACADMKSGHCDMKAMNTKAANMQSGHCDMKPTKTGVKSDKAAAVKHSCCAPKTEKS